MHPSTESGLSPHESSGAPPTAAVHMAVRLWLPDQRQAVSDPSQKGASPPGLLELIEDVVASRNGKLQSNEGRQVHISGLESLTDALVLSRQLQVGVAGFRRRSATVPVSVSIAIDLAASAGQPEASGGTGGASQGGSSHPSHESVSLLKLSRPAQVLLTNDSYLRLGSIGGLPLQSFPARFGVYEYLWTDKSKLEQLQFDPQLALELMTAPTAAMPLASAHTVAGATIAASEPKPRLLPSRWGWPSNPAKLLRSPFLLGAAAAVMISLIAGGIILSKMSHSRRIVPAAPPRTIARGEQPFPPAAPPSPKPAPVALENQAATARSPAKTKPAGAKRQHRAAHASAAAAAPAASECADLATIEQLAEDSRQHGNFQDARRRFQRVLACDPNNKAARLGLEKTIAAMGGRENTP